MLHRFDSDNGAAAAEGRHKNGNAAAFAPTTQSTHTPPRAPRGASETDSQQLVLLSYYMQSEGRRKDTAPRDYAALDKQLQLMGEQGKHPDVIVLQRSLSEQSTMREEVPYLYGYDFHSIRTEKEGAIFYRYDKYECVSVDHTKFELPPGNEVPELNFETLWDENACVAILKPKYSKLPPFAVISYRGVHDKIDASLAKKNTELFFRMVEQLQNAKSGPLHGMAVYVGANFNDDVRENQGALSKGFHLTHPEEPLNTPHEIDYILYFNDPDMDVDANVTRRVLDPRPDPQRITPHLPMVGTFTFKPKRSAASTDPFEAAAPSDSVQAAAFSTKEDTQDLPPPRPAPVHELPPVSPRIVRKTTNGQIVREKDGREYYMSNGAASRSEVFTGPKGGKYYVTSTGIKEYL